MPKQCLGNTRWSADISQMYVNAPAVPAIACIPAHQYTLLSIFSGNKVQLHILCSKGTLRPRHPTLISEFWAIMLSHENSRIINLVCLGISFFGNIRLLSVEWGACVMVAECLLSHVQLFVIPGTAVHGYPIHGIFQARILEWVAISFPNSQSGHTLFLWI